MKSLPNMATSIKSLLLGVIIGLFCSCGWKPKYEVSKVSNYYVDATSGNDNNEGTSPQTAWKTLDKINVSTFRPGEKILFKSGEIWNGQLAFKGSGSAKNPIIVETP